MNELELLPSPSAPEGFPFLENHVRARMGIGREEQQTLRRAHLTEGRDWRLSKKRLWLAQSGVDTLVRLKALPAAAARPDAQTANAGAGEAIAEDSRKSAATKSPAALLFVRATRNPHIIECCLMGDDWLRPKKPLVRVRVRSGVNFRRGMELPAVLVAGYTDLYDLGRACPKKPGKW